MFLQQIKLNNVLLATNTDFSFSYKITEIKLYKRCSINISLDNEIMF